MSHGCPADWLFTGDPAPLACDNIHVVVFCVHITHQAIVLNSMGSVPLKAIAHKIQQRIKGHDLRISLRIWEYCHGCRWSYQGLLFYFSPFLGPFWDIGPMDLKNQSNQGRDWVIYTVHRPYAPQSPKKLAKNKRAGLYPMDLLMQDTQKVTSEVMPCQVLLIINSTAT